MINGTEKKVKRMKESWGLNSEGKKRDLVPSYSPSLEGHGGPEMASGYRTDPVLMHLSFG